MLSEMIEGYIHFRVSCGLSKIKVLTLQFKFPDQCQPGPCARITFQNDSYVFGDPWLGPVKGLLADGYPHRLTPEEYDEPREYSDDYTPGPPPVASRFKRH
jgi:hypothetical protein